MDSYYAYRKPNIPPNHTRPNIHAILKKRSQTRHAQHHQLALAPAHITKHSMLSALGRAIKHQAISVYISASFSTHPPITKMCSNLPLLTASTTAPATPSTASWPKPTVTSPRRPDSPRSSATSAGSGRLSAQQTIDRGWLFLVAHAQTDWELQGKSAYNRHQSHHYMWQQPFRGVHL